MDESFRNLVREFKTSRSRESALKLAAASIRYFGLPDVRGSIWRECKDSWNNCYVFYLPESSLTCPAKVEVNGRFLEGTTWHMVYFSFYLRELGISNYDKGKINV